MIDNRKVCGRCIHHRPAMHADGRSVTAKLFVCRCDITDQVVSVRGSCAKWEIRP